MGYNEFPSTFSEQENHCHSPFQHIRGSLRLFGADGPIGSMFLRSGWARLRLMGWTGSLGLSTDIWDKAMATRCLDSFSFVFPWLCSRPWPLEPSEDGSAPDRIPSQPTVLGFNVWGEASNF